MMLNSNKLVFCSLLLSVICLPVQAEIYKWVDEHGKTHYSQKKPAQDVDVSTVKPPPKVDTEKAIQQQQRKRTADLERKKLQNKKAEAKRQSEADKALSKSNCEKAKARVASMQKPRVNLVDEQGYRTRISEDERQKQLVEAQKAVTQHCK